ncbi:unnamed protein product [Caenorhabditis auriculariae]|uniref:Secreted protein n=1 Tax=Caenorhabditis auriculariae TaxID=2777116 RepID=A0A8S1HSQ6_9PELO|nr:unnamed protein product [Caenorhabditis auriculariae]
MFTFRFESTLFFLHIILLDTAPTAPLLPYDSRIEDTHQRPPASGKTKSALENIAQFRKFFVQSWYRTAKRPESLPSKPYRALKSHEQLESQCQTGVAPPQKTA